MTGRRAAVRVMALSLIAPGAVVFAGAGAAQAAPGTPGVPQAPVTLYTETFENAVPAAGELLTSYKGAKGETYTADAPWLADCNGWVTDFNSTGNMNCASAADADNLRQLAWALGSFAGAAAPAGNHVVAAYTENNPGANLVQFKTVKPIPLPGKSGGRFLSFSVDYGAENCKIASAPQPQFFLTSGGTETPAGSVIDACSSSTTVTAPTVGGNPATDVQVGTYTSNGSVLFKGSSVGVVMRNANGSGGGNDDAFDNIKILDATPQLDKSFSPASVRVGKNSTLTFTVTNTKELAAKDGWSFTDALSAGLTVAASPAAATTCPSGKVTAPSGGSKVTVDGNLSAGMKSCTVTVPVTSKTAGSYTNGPDNITGTGMNPSGTAKVDFTKVPSPVPPQHPVIQTGFGGMAAAVAEHHPFAGKAKLRAAPGDARLPPAQAVWLITPGGSRAAGAGSSRGWPRHPGAIRVPR